MMDATPLAVVVCHGVGQRVFHWRSGEKQTGHGLHVGSRGDLGYGAGP